MPPRIAIENAYTELCRGWQASQAPPSLEVFSEAVARACRAGGYTSADYVSRAILDGRWP